MRVLHVISGLGQGGAEGTLYRLLRAMPPDFKHQVISLLSDGRFGAPIRALGIPVHPLEATHLWNLPKGVCALYRHLQRFKPDVVQTWMYHADLIGGVVARVAGCAAVVWGVRNSLSALPQRGRSVRMAARACALLSPIVPRVIVFNSHRAASRHKDFGY